MDRIVHRAHATFTSDRAHDVRADLPRQVILRELDDAAAIDQCRRPAVARGWAVACHIVARRIGIDQPLDVSTERLVVAAGAMQKSIALFSRKIDCLEKQRFDSASL